MLEVKRQWKQTREESMWNQFKIYRNIYFKSIRKAKEKCWIEFLENANAQNQDVFKALKYTSNKIRKV